MEYLVPSLLTIGLPLIAVPPLIHLINVRRRRRIEWAAMEFLLESQRRNKRWILLKQLLVMLARTAAIALVVFMLAGPVLQSGWGAIFGRGATHHLILLDDSYSMSDETENGVVFERAKQAVSQILRQARGRSELQTVTLLTFSQAAEYQAGEELSFSQRPLDAEMLAELDATMRNMKPSETAAGPVEAFDAATRLPEPTGDETRITYVVSDFRQRQWNEEAQLSQLAERAASQCAELQLVQCVRKTRPNLAITRLEPHSGVRAADVETWMEISVANYGDDEVVGVIASIEQDGRKLPSIEFDKIAAGDEASRRFRITFPEAGARQLVARLEADAITLDNIRYFTAEIPPTFPVLVIDGSVDGDDSFYLRNALSPGGSSLAGWSPQVEPPGYLRQSADLSRFAAIFVLDAPRINEQGVTALEEYVRSGGGVAMFLGPNVDRSYYNEHLYRDGVGLLPEPLGVPTQLVHSGSQAAADLSVADHPVFSVFQGQRNSFLPLVNVDFYHALDNERARELADGSEVIASLRNGAPLVIERTIGDGRLIVQLTRLSPKRSRLGAWNNLALNPVFPVLANELTGRLSANRRSYDGREVGATVDSTETVDEFEPEVEIQLPLSAGGQLIEVTAAEEGQNYRAVAPNSLSSGIWKFNWKRRDGLQEVRQVAVNVPTGEGDLHHLERQELDQRLSNIKFTYSLATEIAADGNSLAGLNLSDALLYTLAITLVVEQLLAYSAGYHRSAERPQQ